MEVSPTAIRGVDAELQRLRRENERLHRLLACIALGIGAADGFGYRAKHGLAVVQELFETVDAGILSQTEKAVATDEQEMS